MHRSSPFEVPVVVRRSSFDDQGIRRRAESGEFAVALSRTDGEADTWLYLGEGPGAAIDVSAESAHRLLRAASIRLGDVGRP